MGTGYPAASGPLLSRAPPQLWRQGHGEDHSPGRGRREPLGWVGAAKGQCFLFQGEQRPSCSVVWSCRLLRPHFLPGSPPTSALLACYFCHQFTASSRSPPRLYWGCSLLPLPTTPHSALTSTPAPRLTPGIFVFQHTKWSRGPSLVPPQ